MLIDQQRHVLATSTGSMTVFVISPRIPDYPHARFPGVVVWSEIYNVTGPVLRFANAIASQGYVVACPVVFHEAEGDREMLYNEADTNLGNRYKEEKLLTAYDSDAKATLDLLISLPICNGRIGATGMCLGGHLAFRNALDPRILASVCYFPTDIHSGTLGSPVGATDTLERAGKGEIKGETILIFGVNDGHIPPAGRSLIRSTLTDPSIQPPLRLSFLELQASHAFIRDELSKGRFDAGLSKVCFELLLECFGRTIARDLGERVLPAAKEEKLVC